MTTIAWDGTSLAGDKLIVNSGLKVYSTKIYRIKNMLIGTSGTISSGKEMIHWLSNEEKIENFPPSQLDEDSWAPTLVIRNRKIFVYERSPFPYEVEDKFFAIGSGRDFSLASMYLGKSAKESIEIASKFDVNTSYETDVLLFE